MLVGAGQTGLNIGARFKQMGIRTIIIEKNNRVGDVWRKRYPTLVLHTPRPHHSRTKIRYRTSVLYPHHSLHRLQ